jgi:formylmethanofuran dehydrogenase subunit E
MSILGARLGSAALAAVAEGGGRLQARFHHQTCALDGIQVTTHCTAGNGNLQIRPQGQHRLLLWREGMPAGVEASLTPEALERGKAYARLREEASSLSAESEGRKALEVRMENLLHALEGAPEAELVRVAETEILED